jgi:hypothetical protein
MILDSARREIHAFKRRLDLIRPDSGTEPFLARGESSARDKRRNIEQMAGLSAG